EEVIKINQSARLMPAFNINVVIFIPGKEFIFGSFNFIAGIDGSLHISNLKTIRSSQIESDLASHNATRFSSKSDSVRLERRIAPPRYLFGFNNSANVNQHVLRQVMELRPEYGVYSGGEENRVDDVIHPADDKFRVVN